MPAVVEDVISRFSGVNVQLTPYGIAESVDDPALTGAPAQDMLTKPVKLLPGVIVATTDAASPGAATVTDVGLMDRAKLSALTAEETARLSERDAA